MLESYVKKILCSRVYDVAVETPIHAAPFLSERLGNTVLLKREDLQPVFSFKIRGAYNKLAQLTDEQRACGVVTASAGNHAQGLALAARHMGVKATIVMPRMTPNSKVSQTRVFGAEVILHGNQFDETLELTRHAVDLGSGNGTLSVLLAGTIAGPSPAREHPMAAVCEVCVRRDCA